MIFEPTPLAGAWTIELEPHRDERGFFARAFCADEFAERGLRAFYPQYNISQNKQGGTVRGMHFQIKPHEETKVVRCTRGAIQDVIVDIRPSSPTFGKHFGLELSAANYKMLYVPEGFAHGFQTLEDDTEVFYMMSHVYAPRAARGFRYNDPRFGIKWPEPVTLISERDAAYPDFTNSLLTGTGA